MNTIFTEKRILIMRELSKERIQAARKDRGAGHE